MGRGQENDVYMRKKREKRRGPGKIKFNLFFVKLVGEGGQHIPQIYITFFLKKSPISENIGYIFLNPTYISPIR